nr:hypothetical protein [Methanofollis aquaemaris]
MWNVIQLKNFFDSIHQIDELDRIAVAFSDDLPEDDERHQLRLSIGFPGEFTGIERNMGVSDNVERSLKKVDITVR